MAASPASAKRLTVTALVVAVGLSSVKSIRAGHAPPVRVAFGAGIAGAIVTVALVTTVVSHKESAHVITAIGTAFSGALRAAQGK